LSGIRNSKLTSLIVIGLIVITVEVKQNKQLWGYDTFVLAH
jgi:hypothetical protein